jgi:hypothetical protein
VSLSLTVDSLAVPGLRFNLHWHRPGEGAFITNTYEPGAPGDILQPLTSFVENPFGMANQSRRTMTASEYIHSLAKTPQLLGKRAFHVRDPADQLADKAAAGGEMEKCLNWFHVAMLGTGECVDVPASGGHRAAAVTAPVALLAGHVSRPSHRISS